MRFMRRKAGRPPKAAGNKKSDRLSVRISSKLRSELEKARRRPHGEVSLAEQVEQMLWSSLTAQSDIEKRFGGHTTSNLLAILADQIMAIELLAGGESWLDSPWVFAQARAMIDFILDHRKPRGRAGLPENVRRWPPLLKANVENIGRDRAREALALLEAASSASVEEELKEPRPSPHYFDKALARGLRGSPLAELEEHRQRTHARMEWYWESRGTSGDARRRKVDALLARKKTVDGLVGYLRAGLVEGAKIDIAKVLKGVTGANLLAQKSAIIDRIKSATAGKLIGPAPTFDSDLARILEAAAKWESSDEVISDRQHRDMQRRTEAKRIQKGSDR
jgi:hypothetical protein